MNPFSGRHPLVQGIDPLRTLRVLLRHRHVDAVIAVFEGPAVLPALLRRLFRFRPRLLMWDLGLTDWRLRRRIQDLVIPRLDEILVLGSNQTADIVARWPAHAPVTCIGHYVDTGFFRPLPPSEDAGFLLSVGDDEGRDYNTLMQSVAGLDTKVVIRSCHQLTAAHPRLRQITQRISFLELRQLYADATIAVVPLQDRPHAGGVSAVLEAAAMGCAMVVADSAGIRDYCVDGETCLKVPCGDVAALAAAIRRLMADAALRERLGRNARAFAVQECSTEAFARRLAARLRSIST
jgi:glycosyltransferase involved in cell wall biosynthesis